MAISHVQPLLLPLLLSLFFLPAALNATRFSKCDPHHSYPVVASGVVFSPDDDWIKTSTNANITLSAQTYTNISDGATVTFSIWGYISDDRKYSLCDLVPCPISPGPLVFTLPNAFTEEELNRVKMYYKYLATLKITVEHQEDPMMCIVFDCFVTAETVPA